ncbi:hypothetical protein Mbo4_007 [Rhodococcus phage Mbo4]|uniref:Head-to-tail connector protein n=1 Tax=Rhodococcus phage Mbo4 TaxID=2936912 RepID=A0A9E7ISI6_9CAUD|nr:hypothetical protein [Rhodococcus opacus]YP_010755912.1 hypothetical protein QEH50_gp07 [Rhodococcus phage Mbo4]URG17497.1 hypothetical protein Mbo4_007 [Rhodococcus phage Mbo4]
MIVTEYVLVADQFDQIVSEPGEPLEYKRRLKGDVVVLDEAEALRLISAGAVAPVGLAAEADDEDGEDPASGDLGDAGTDPAADDGEIGAPVRPKRAALAKDWEDYVVALHEFTGGKDGLTRAEAEAATREALIAQFAK